MWWWSRVPRKFARLNEHRVAWLMITWNQMMYRHEIIAPFPFPASAWEDTKLFMIHFVVFYHLSLCLKSMLCGIFQILFILFFEKFIQSIHLIPQLFPDWPSPSFLPALLTFAFSCFSFSLYLGVLPNYSWASSLYCSVVDRPGVMPLKKANFLLSELLWDADNFLASIGTFCQLPSTMLGFCTSLVQAVTFTVGSYVRLPRGT